MRSSLLLSVLLGGCLSLSPSNLHGQEMELNVMSFNVWGADNQTQKLAEVIQAGNADIVGIQELENNGLADALAAELGWFRSRIGNRFGTQVLSRFQFIETSGGQEGIQVELSPGQNAWIFNSHLTAYPYQPYDLRDDPTLTEAQLIAGADQTRGAEVTSLLNDIASATSAGDRVFLTGDYNEPSHLDWTQAAADATARTFDKKVAYPTSTRITNAGFTDSFRAVRPDVVNDRGYTWTPINSANEVHDRIDLVYHRGPGVTANQSLNIGANANNPNTDIAVGGFPSDHRATVTGFTVALADSTLTFYGLGHNPGNDGELTAGGYGDALLPTPNIMVEYAASSGSNWDTYNGDEDGSSNNWNGGVAQLQGSTGSEYDLSLIADDGYAVMLDSFDLVDYAGFLGGHTVDWELWSGEAGLGTFLVGGQETIVTDGVNSVLTGYDSWTTGRLSLRLRHVAGDGTDLALDNVRFSQTAVPEPGGLVMLLACGAGLVLRRRRS